MIHGPVTILNTPQRYLTSLPEVIKPLEEASNFAASNSATTSPFDTVENPFIVKKSVFFLCIGTCFRNHLHVEVMLLNIRLNPGQRGYFIFGLHFAGVVARLS